MRRASLTVTVLLFAISLAAQEANTPRVVRTTGSAEIKVLPNEAVIQVGVENQSANARTAKTANDAATRKILDVVREFGIDPKDVQTSYMALSPEFDYVKGKRLVSYDAVQTLTVRVADLEKVDDLLAALVKAGSNRIDSIEYRASELRKFQDQARELAVQAAREKARALAKGLGQDIGKARSIEENAGQGFSTYANAFALPPKAKVPVGPTTASGQLTVRAEVTVSFDLI